ncbi:transglutaminase [Tengunoibacter tsumagoiensis]|uniref:Transglutaminase n=2 Tax=Tengunoibacter tsumagoiensis TaxID=2014871 RepID=A0A402A6S6_9CHLR|nr:transglutaminase [Tengunoibacter tsumagoiensis]
MYYTVQHITKFRYSAPITESIMEVRIQPRSEGQQHCLDFRLTTSPRTQILTYRDDLSNRVHHFDIPNSHSHLTITAEAIVEVLPPLPLPDELSASAWEELDALTANDEYWDMLKPSHFTQPSEIFYAFMRELDIQRRHDPLSALHEINHKLYASIEYAKKNTRVDSPIDDALRIRRGVCQDFAHIMITMVRSLQIPCRYVSGYLFARGNDPRAQSSAGATHAWVEALLPGLGWVGFDPTNDTLAGERHIRIAVGRDYSDVPPTHGIFRGKADSDLSVSVRVFPTEAPPLSAELSLEADWIPVMHTAYEPEENIHLQPQQQ